MPMRLMHLMHLMRFRLRFGDLSSSQARLALALVASLVLHLLLLLHFDGLEPLSHGSRASFTVSLMSKSQVPPAASEQSGAPPAGKAATDALAPSVSGAPRPNATPEPAIQAASRTEASASRGQESVRQLVFFANATLLGTFPLVEVAGNPVMQNPAYMPVDNLAPRPALPDRFEIAYPNAAKPAGLKSTVKIAVLIDEAGRVVEAAGLDDSPEIAVLVDAAVQTLRRTRLQPGQRAGTPVKSKAVVVVRFSFE